MDTVKVRESAKHGLLEITPAQDRSAKFLRDWIEKNEPFVGAKIALYGGILFKGFDIKSPLDFEMVALAIESDLASQHVFDGCVGTRRTKFVSDVASPKVKKMPTPLSLHNEDSFAAETPKKIMFCSLDSAPWGGESLVADCRKVYQSLPRRVQKKYRRQKLKNTLVLEDHLFLANSQVPKNVARITEFAKGHGAEAVRRLSDTMTEFSFTVPAVITEGSQEPIWFNTLHQAVFYNKCIDIWMAYKCFGGFFNRVKSLFLICSSLIKDFAVSIRAGRHSLTMHECKLVNGEKITAWDRIQIGLAWWKHTAVVSLNEGDFFVLDNRRTAHGRMPYKGRRLMVSAMSQPEATEAAKCR